eukprot:356760-Chlamydomonas_euryale.AAC.2
MVLLHMACTCAASNPFLDISGLTAESIISRFLHYTNPANASRAWQESTILPGIYSAKTDWHSQEPRPFCQSGAPSRHLARGGAWHIELKSDNWTLCQDHVWSLYMQPIMELRDMSTVNPPVGRAYATVFVGDCNVRLKRRTLTKSRILDDVNGVLLPLNYARHWKHMDSFADTIPFERKNDRVVWRGGTTGATLSLYHGKTLRHAFVEWCFDHPKPYVDVGFSKIVQNARHMERYAVQHLSQSELLENKFLVFLEGNDVSTGLKWALMSNSVVFMPPPMHVSWLMEDILLPWVHYVPLKHDFSDLHTHYEWAMNNYKECNKIIMNANQFMQQFKNPQVEKALRQAVYDFYVKHDMA